MKMIQIILCSIIIALVLIAPLLILRHIFNIAEDTSHAIYLIFLTTAMAWSLKPKAEPVVASNVVHIKRNSPELKLIK